MTKRTGSEIDTTGFARGLFIDRYPPVEKIQFDPMRVSTSRDEDVAALMTRVRAPVFEAEFEGIIDKRFIPVEMSNFRDLVITKVKGPVKVEPHTHPGTMFGLVISGRLRINGVELTEGDFYLVPPGQPYGIESKEGYHVIAGYSHSC